MTQASTSAKPVLFGALLGALVGGELAVFMVLHAQAASLSGGLGGLVAWVIGVPTFVVGGILVGIISSAIAAAVPTTDLRGYGLVFAAPLALTALAIPFLATGWLIAVGIPVVAASAIAGGLLIARGHGARPG